MTAVQPPSFTRYSVEDERQVRRGRKTVVALWALIAAACAVIIVFAYLILSGGLA